ncbi:alpha-2-macroglobulin receptor-associated protein [Ctenodactylus gundi]
MALATLNKGHQSPRVTDSPHFGETHSFRPRGFGLAPLPLPDTPPGADRSPLWRPLPRVSHAVPALGDGTATRPSASARRAARRRLSHPRHAPRSAGRGPAAWPARCPGSGPGGLRAVPGLALPAMRPGPGTVPGDRRTQGPSGGAAQVQPPAPRETPTRARPDRRARGARRVARGGDRGAEHLPLPQRRRRRPSGRAVGGAGVGAGPTGSCPASAPSGRGVGGAERSVEPMGGDRRVRGRALAVGGAWKKMAAWRERVSGLRWRSLTMSPLSPLLLLLLLGPRPGSGHGGKYSREKNEPPSPTPPVPGEEFRMEKLNQLWEKARRLHLSPVKMAALHADLKLQEREELNWKKLKVDGLDADGEKEAKLVRSLSVILARYGLDGRKDSQVGRGNSLDDTQDDGLGDPRLEKLWHKAKTSGKFSGEELDKLWREFQHHKEKVQEYNILLETLSRTEEAYENAIGPLDWQHGKADVLLGKHGELKDKLRSINQGLDRLRKVSHQGYGPAAEFEEPRVIDLWDLAQSANFTEKELESFREELKHFEAKIEKHSHYQKQLELSHQKLRHVERVGDAEHVSRNKEKYALLEEKTKELGYKVKKHLQDLSSRVSRARHNEL